MAAECTCGHPQSQHKGGKGGCRNCDLGCARFEPETAAEPAVAPVPAEELAAVAVGAQLDITAERDDLKRQLDDLGKLHMDLARELGETKKDIARHKSEAASLRAANDKLVDIAHERDDALGELAKVLAEHAALNQLAERMEHAAGCDPDDPFEDAVAVVEMLRRGRDEATERALDLAAELKGARDEIGTLKAQLGHAEPHENTIAALFAQAEASGTPELIGAASAIRGQLGQLELDLAAHARTEQLRAELAQVEERAAEIRRELGEDTPAPPPPVDNRLVREWAGQNGFAVAPRGPIPPGVIAAYRQAHSVPHSTHSAAIHHTEGAPTA